MRLLDLGVMYEKGMGVPEDYVMAFMWYSLAKTQGAGLSVGNMNILRWRVKS